MKFLIIYFLFLGPGADLTYIRELYVKAASKQADTEVLLKTLLNNRQDAVNLAYTGAATMLMAKHSNNPYNKLKYFQRGKALLETAINSEAENVEARYLRYTIQSNLPEFLGYNNDLPGDKRFLIRNLPTLKDKDLQKSIYRYLIEQTPLSAEEKKLLNRSGITFTACK